MKNKIYLFFALLITIIGIWGVFFYQSSNQTAEKGKENLPKQERQTGSFSLSIPAINVSTPIIADVPGNDSTAYFKALQMGVAHYKNSAKPGQKGNIFIFGHSSYYFWDPGQYKEIFKNLNSLNIDDQIIIDYNNNHYHYAVTQKRIVLPSQTEVLLPTTNEQLTLMTCYPVGTDKKRLIVIAEPSTASYQE